MSRYKKWVKRLILINAIVISFIIAFVFLVDPLQYYRVSGYEPYFSTEQRYQNPGLAKNYDYNSVIVGTSMSENFIPSHFDSTFNVKTLKLAMSGATAKEQSHITQLAIKTGKVENIFWEIHFDSLRGESQRLRANSTFPLHFYDEKILNELSYLFNITNLKHSITAIKADFNLIAKNNDLDMLNNWNEEHQDNFSRKVVIDDYQKSISNPPSWDPNEFNLKPLIDSFNVNILEVVRDNPTIEFHFYYPPYSILYYRWHDEIDSKIVDNMLEFKKIAFDKLNEYPNVKVSDFQHDQPTTSNLDNYRDLGHYSEEINDFMMNSMFKEDFLVTTENVDRNINMLAKQIKELDLNKYIPD